MKKLFMVLAICLMIAGIARAEINVGETLKKIPSLNQGIAYSILDSNFNYLSTIELLKWKGWTLEAGYSSSDKAVGVISYQLLRLKDYIDLPILDLIEFNLGLYGGFGRLAFGPGNAKDNNEWDAGISATLIKIKF